MEKILINFTDAQAKKLREISKKTELNLNELVRRIIDSYIKTEKVK